MDVNYRWVRKLGCSGLGFTVEVTMDTEPLSDLDGTQYREGRSVDYQIQPLLLFFSTWWSCFVHISKRAPRRIAEDDGGWYSKRDSGDDPWALALQCRQGRTLESRFQEIINVEFHKEERVGSLSDRASVSTVSFSLNGAYIAIVDSKDQVSSPVGGPKSVHGGVLMLHDPSPRLDRSAHCGGLWRNASSVQSSNAVAIWQPPSLDMPPRGASIGRGVAGM